jgi:uncharacterized SAM-binding protein YcdF (DUF218 family)
MQRLIVALASPLGAAMLLALFASVAFVASRVLRRRSARTARGLANASGAACALAVAVVLIASTSAVARAVTEPLEVRALALAAQAPAGPYDAIVVLGGALQPPPHHPAAEIELNDAADRVLHAARLWHRGVAPVIVASGGPAPRPDQDLRYPEAEAMREVLVALGVPRQAVVVEGRSANTRENVRFTAALLGGARKVALVTSAVHMPRALREARAARLDAHAFPTDFKTLDRWKPIHTMLWPNPEALQLTGLSIKEWLGVLADALGVGGPDRSVR